VRERNATGSWSQNKIIWEKKEIQRYIQRTGLNPWPKPIPKPKRKPRAFPFSCLFPLTINQRAGGKAQQ